MFSCEKALIVTKATNNWLVESPIHFTCYVHKFHVKFIMTSFSSGQTATCCFWNFPCQMWSCSKNCRDYQSVSSAVQLCPTLCDLMDCSTPGLPVHHQLPEFTQTHVHWVSDVIQPSHPLSSSSLPIFNHSQHQGLF